MRPLAFRDPPSRRPTLRVRRRRTRAIALLVFLALVALGAYGVSYASYLPQLSIERIEVSGTSEVQPEAVTTFVESHLESHSFSFISPRNIFLYPRRTIETALREYFPHIESAKISRESLLATAVVVSVKERKPFARWCETTDSCYAIDSGGFIFAPASTTLSGFETAYLFEGALPEASSPVGQTYLPARFSGMIALLERLGQAGFSSRRISLDGEQDFTVGLADRFQLRVTFGSDVSAIVKNLELILDSETLRGKEGELEYIDLRFGNRVYYKLRGADQQTAE